MEFCLQIHPDISITNFKQHADLLNEIISEKISLEIMENTFGTQDEFYPTTQSEAKRGVQDETLMDGGLRKWELKNLEPAPPKVAAPINAPLGDRKFKENKKPPQEPNLDLTDKQIEFLNAIIRIYDAGQKPQGGSIAKKLNFPQGTWGKVMDVLETKRYAKRSFDHDGSKMLVPLRLANGEKYKQLEVINGIKQGRPAYAEGYA